MFEKMIGVSPPQVGKAQDSKVNKSDFRETAESKSLYKFDFDKALKEKVNKQQRDLEKKQELAKREELRADKKEKKSSGGIKKKMTDVDDKMVSNGMASKENVVEIPSSKEQELAEIQVNPNEKLNGLVERFSLADEAALAKMTFTETAPDQSALSEAGQQIVDAQALKAQANGMVPPAEVAPQAGKQNSLEGDLEAAVGFQPNAEMVQANKDLVNKLKSFESELKPATEEAKANLFEKNVLAQLQKDSAFNSNQSSSQGDQGASFENKDKSDLKGEMLNNQLHQASGQSHSQFKTHLDGAAGLQHKADANSSLENHREANINEIMSKAQYLVNKGGGEVTVKMSPEGMGEVHLKVQLLDGKLNIEMQTQDKNVKKLIEESLSDLKSGLAAHRLSLEHVKIDTVNATNADNNTQMQSNLHQGGGEGRGREFWNETQGQMNQQSQKRFSSEASHNANRTAATPVTRTSQAQALRTYGGTKGATVNRVA